MKLTGSGSQDPTGANQAASMTKGLDRPYSRYAFIVHTETVERTKEGKSGISLSEAKPPRRR